MNAKDIANNKRSISMKLNAAKLKAKDPQHFAKIGKIGGQNGKTIGFAHGKVDPSKVGKVRREKE